MIEIHVDGASKDNNIKDAVRRASICVVIPSEDFKIIEHIGNKTNNQAEWDALIEALKLAQLRGWKEIKIYSDSQLVVEQFNDRWKVKDTNLSSSYLVAKTLEGLFDVVDLQWISRSQNLAGIELERRT